VVIDLLRDNDRSRAYRTFLAGHGLAMSIITYGEIYEGIYSAPEPERQEKGFLSLLKAITVVNLTPEIMKAFAMMRMDLRRAGQLIGDLDTLIAATAYEAGTRLVTRNRKHFERIPGVTLAPEP
jgi:tRNA(fMet)-specific endonuclease VapC